MDVEIGALEVIKGSISKANFSGQWGERYIISGISCFEMYRFPLSLRSPLKTGMESWASVWLQAAEAKQT